MVKKELNSYEQLIDEIVTYIMVSDMPKEQKERILKFTGYHLDQLTKLEIYDVYREN